MTQTKKPVESVQDLKAQIEAQAEGQSERQIARLKHDLARSKAERKAAENEMHAAQRLREHVFGLVDEPTQPPGWLLEKSKAKDSPHVAVLVASDFHWGEVIDPENMDGINKYNVAIAEARYRKLIGKTIDISLGHLTKNRYEGIIYLRLGDMAGGDIHDELRETNEVSAIPSVRSLVAAEKWGIEELRKAFGAVHVVSVPGNHSRVTRKPPFKRVTDNYDTLSAWWLESAFSAKKITWQTATSTDAVFDIHGRRYLATHGDHIGSRGGQGFVGPAATILRGMKKTMDEYSRRGDVLSKMFVGHFHVPYYLGYGWSNGSLAGYNEYGRGHRMTPEVPIQWLLYFHPKHGVTSHWQVRLEESLGSRQAARPFRTNP